MKPLKIEPNTLILALEAGIHSLERIDAEDHARAIAQLKKLHKELARVWWDTDAVLWIIEAPY